jgi:hypothetical protein
MMTTVKCRNLELSWHYLALGAAPMGVHLLSDLLLHLYGQPTNGIPALRPFDGHAETAARLVLLSSFLFFLGVVVVSVAAFTAALRTLCAQSLKTVLKVLLGMLAIGALLIQYSVKETSGLTGDLGDNVYEAAFSSLNGFDLSRPRTTLTINSLSNILYAWQWLLYIGASSLVFGAVTTLASPRGAEMSPEYLEVQAKRLNGFLYISAILMIATLLFIANCLRWPRFAFADNRGLDMQIDAAVLYYGVSYSVFLAAYYVPLAWCLTRRADRLGSGEVQEKIVGIYRNGALALLNIAAVLAPTAAGLLSAVIQKA